jgi:SAM-dependent methyltransferase
MTNRDASFTGSIPAHYDRCLGPMLFEPYAKDLVERLTMPPGGSVLEIAAGTGIVTRHLRQRLPSDARLVVTDLNAAMLDVAREKIPADDRIEWQTVDAAALPFADSSFAVVVCQFGVMFFPDKPGALREIHRVLEPSGKLLFNVWGSLGDNPIGNLAHEVIASFFPTEPPQFYTVPFGLHDETQIRQMLGEAGFPIVTCEIVDRVGESELPELAAKGLIFGSPVLIAIEERGTVDPVVVMHALAARLVTEGGAAPMKLPMRALVFTAVRDGGS